MGSFRTRAPTISVSEARLDVLQEQWKLPFSKFDFRRQRTVLTCKPNLLGIYARAGNVGLAHTILKQNNNRQMYKQFNFK